MKSRVTLDIDSVGPWGGGIESWVQRCLNLAYLPNDAPMFDLFASQVRPWPTEHDDAAEARVRSAHDLKKKMLAVIGSYPRVNTTSTARPGRVKDVVIDADLDVGADGSLRHTLAYYPQTNTAAVHLLTLFLDDPVLGLGRALRRCAWDSCGRAFISRAGTRGGPRPRYCDPEHQAAADREDAIHRMARKRAKDSRETT